MPVVTTLTMAPSSETDDGNGAFSSDPPTEETTTTKRQCLNSSVVSLTSPSTSSFGDWLHAPPLPTLPFELVVDILTRLPVKFLMQLRSVCKSWKSLISDPDFAKKHLRVSNTRHRVLLMFSELSPEFIIMTYPLYSVSTEVTPTATQLEYPPGNRNRFECIVGSCHGIICIKLYCNFFVLWNPSIRKFTTSRHQQCYATSLILAMIILTRWLPFFAYAAMELTETKKSSKCLYHWYQLLEKHSGRFSSSCSSSSFVLNVR